MTTDERLAKVEREQARATLIIAIVCVSLVLLVILFPPWWNDRASWGHSFLWGHPFDRPYSDSALYMPMLLLEILGILCAGVLAWLIVKLVASRKGDNP